MHILISFHEFQKQHVHISQKQRFAYISQFPIRWDVHKPLTASSQIIYAHNSQ